MVRINLSLGARAHFLAWIQGTAIALAVLIVASVGSFVDWRKEIQFIKSRAETNKKNIVSNTPFYLKTRHFQAMIKFYLSLTNFSAEF